MQLAFDNQFTASLPADPETANFRRQVQHAIYSRVAPTPVRAPQTVAYTAAVAAMIGLTEQNCSDDAFAQIFGGNRLLDGMDPHATCYGGHQFGNWAGQLGDGRAINLGEVNHGGRHFMLQLKGAGPTPYSRSADGLAVLRSSVREFLCSEAMHHLGIASTRALSLVKTGEWVTRDMLYDGHPQEEPGAVVCRVSSCFVRFGHFQMLAARNEIELLRTFTDFLLRREFPHLCGPTAPDRDTYIAWFEEICTRTVELMVQWMRVGFVHGVMNTDNMSIIGETIDYGPYGWLDDFDPNWTPNTTDAATRRYRYAQQPVVAQWNLMQLANAILPLIGDPKPLENALSAFGTHYQQGWQQMMAAKLGLNEYDESLIDGLIQLLSTVETDMTLFFRRLASIDPAAAHAAQQFHECYYQPEQITPAITQQTSQWLSDYAGALRNQNVDPATRPGRMNAVNPKYVLRNYLAQLAIDGAEQGDYSTLLDLQRVLRKPYDEQPEFEQHYAQKRPEWARTRVGCSMLSCSS